MKRLLSQCIVTVILIGSCADSILSQTVTRCPDSALALPQRWAWALKEAGCQPNGTSVWIGYSIAKMMRRNSFTGTMYSDARRNSPSLCEELGLDVCVKEDDPFRSMHNFSMTEGMTYTGDGDGGSGLVEKELGILFEIASGEHTRVTGGVMSNFSLHVDLRGEPVYWLGEAREEESLAFLRARYNEGQAEKIQKKIITIAGMHTPSEEVVAFLADVLEHGKQLSLRKEAAFWLGETNSGEALRLLMKTAEDETSGELREESIFAISQMADSIGTEPLITLAKSAGDHEVRNKAMFWLGQKASRKATATLKEIVESGDDTEIQKHALYALTESASGGAVDELIHVAREHRNPELRKQAIYMLGESEDKRALDALVSILRDK